MHLTHSPTMIGNARSTAPPPPSDASIIARSLVDPPAFGVLFDRHWAAIHAYCTSRAGAAGEDLAADAFRTAFAQRDRYDGQVPEARPWLFGIAANLLRQHFRSAQRADRAGWRAAVRNASDAVSAATAEEPLSQLEAQQLGPELTAALGTLPAVDREALLLLAWGELDYAGIAQALSIPVGTVRSRIHRARRRLRGHLAIEGDTTHA